MITEDYVSFEVAKLLKGKGFDVNTFNKYADKGGATEEWYDDDQERRVRFNWDNGTLINPPTEPQSQYKVYGHTIPAPTLQMAMKWLEEVHHILVVPDYIYECTNTSWVYKIFRLGENGKPEKVAIKGVSYDKNNNPTEHIVGYRDYEVSYKDYATREEAEEEGIRYVLENLI